MLGQMNIYGLNMVEQAIKRIQTFEPSEGYYLAFSGGKDSVVVKALCDMAEAKYDAYYHVTSIDPPELVRFIKENYDGVIFEKQYFSEKDKLFPGKQITMRRLIMKYGAPSRIYRFCCKYLKENAKSSRGRFVITGVRKAESAKRSKRGGLEVGDTNTSRRQIIDPDNPDQEMVHNCIQKAQRILNPIIDWSDDDVWEFIREYNVPYCSLYDEGQTRIGCIGCPMAGKHRLEEFERWPGFYRYYMRAFYAMQEARPKIGLDVIKTPEGNTDAESIMKWWLSI